MTVDLAVATDEVEVPDPLGHKIGDQAVVEAICDPGPEGMHLEEDALLAESIELRIAVEEAGGDELVEDAHDKRRENGEEDVIEGKSPGFEDDLTREGVLEGVLDQ